MKGIHLFLSLTVAASLITGCAGNAAHVGAAPAVSSAGPDAPPVHCPVTVPQDPPFIPPAPYSDLGFEGDFWYGSPSLWTAVPPNGVWASLPGGPDGYSQKIFWWRDSYLRTEEPLPELVVTGERLDAEAPPLKALRATNAYAADIGSAMLTGVDFPTRGCWRVTGRYGDTELGFVVWIAP